MVESPLLPSVYDAEKVETKWYSYWKENGFFSPDKSSEAKTFTIVMPPPNVTGSLHLGHALDNALQDVLTRWRRMQGYNTLWLPGTDHAGIATQARVEEMLAQDNISRQELGREGFLERVWQWKELYGSKITEQLTLLGSSCDWTRERFTMDDGCSRAVREVFVNLYKKGLIYQGDYIVNWCPKCNTAISDIEVEHEDKDGFLWHIKYPVAGSEEYLVVATTRPETMLGDTGVAVHPEDDRYRHLIGNNVVLPLVNRIIPVFADEYVERDFGSGAVKVTPSHDPNDFDMGQRHNLEQITVMDLSGIMNENAGSYAGMKREDCRRKVVADLEKQGLLLKIQEHRHGVGHCQRCNTIIEPMLSKQWFVKMLPLAQPAIAAVKSGQIRFIPERFTKTYINWMENIRDWCISRQLWWGHRIPVWYCQDCGAAICSKTDPSVCTNCGSGNLCQDEDVLDTWFSSALWPFSTLGWPDETDDLKRFYPTSVLVTGRDIIFFWVARMIFSGIEHTGQVPFSEVNIHGLILDGDGRKMSKSLGNGIDPIEVIERFGADTLRWSMLTGVTPGNDIRFYWDKVENNRAFANKIWNAARFVLMNLTGYEPINWEVRELTLSDRWILSRLHDTVNEVTALMERYDLGEAAKQLYEFIWNDYCDWYIELTKPLLTKNDNSRSRLVTQNILRDVLVEALQLLHPFMPFITEEIYQHMPGHSSSIMRDKWPQAGSYWPHTLGQMQQVMQTIRAIRNIRAEFNLSPSLKIKVILAAAESDSYQLLRQNQNIITAMGNLGDFVLEQNLAEKPRQAASALTSFAEIYVPLEGLIDIGKELERLNKELKSANADLEKSVAKLNNEKFMARAPQEVIAKENTKISEANIKKEGLLLRLQMLKS